MADLKAIVNFKCRQFLKCFNNFRTNSWIDIKLIVNYLFIVFFLIKRRFDEKVI